MCESRGGFWVDLESCVGPGVDLDLETLVPIEGGSWVGLGWILKFCCQRTGGSWVDLELWGGS